MSRGTAFPALRLLVFLFLFLFLALNFIPIPILVVSRIEFLVLFLRHFPSVLVVTLVFLVALVFLALFLIVF